MVLNELSRISDVQKAFSRKFPYLKIEFFNAPFLPMQLLPTSKVFDKNEFLKRCVLNNNKGLTNSVNEVKLTSTMSVLKLETELWEKYGLSSQIFRRSGNMWIETSLTGFWTLEQQNREGEQLAQSKYSEYDLDSSDRDQAD